MTTVALPPGSVEDVELKPVYTTARTPSDITYGVFTLLTIPWVKGAKIPPGYEDVSLLLWGLAYGDVGELEHLLAREVIDHLHCEGRVRLIALRHGPEVDAVRVVVHGLPADDAGVAELIRATLSELALRRESDQEQLACGRCGHPIHQHQHADGRGFFTAHCMAPLPPGTSGTCSCSAFTPRDP